MKSECERNSQLDVCCSSGEMMKIIEKETKTVKIFIGESPSRIESFAKENERSMLEIENFEFWRNCFNSIHWML